MKAEAGGDEPWLSVILPTFNGAAYLTHALDSILAQGDEDVELIVVDDGSDDDTVAIAQSFSANLSLRIVQQGHAGNWVTSTNVGLGLARGEYVCLLHQDDGWGRDRLRVLRSAISQAGEASLIIHQVDYIDAHGRSVGRLRCPLPARVCLSSDLVIEHLLVQNFISLPAALFRRDHALQVGGLDDALVYTADWDLWLKLASLGMTYYLPVSLASFRVHHAAQTAKLSTASTELRRQLEEVLERHLGAWKTPEDRGEVEKAARFSIETNVALGAALHRDWGGLGRVGADFVRLGPAGWRRYLRDSRVLERASARLRGRVGRSLASE